VQNVISIIEEPSSSQRPSEITMVNPPVENSACLVDQPVKNQSSVLLGAQKQLSPVVSDHSRTGRTAGIGTTDPNHPAATAAPNADTHASTDLFQAYPDITTTSFGSFPRRQTSSYVPVRNAAVLDTAFAHLATQADSIKAMSQMHARKKKSKKNKTKTPRDQRQVRSKDIRLDNSSTDLTQKASVANDPEQEAISLLLSMASSSSPSKSDDIHRRVSYVSSSSASGVETVSTSAPTAIEKPKKKDSFAKRRKAISALVPPTPTTNSALEARYAYEVLKKKPRLDEGVARKTDVMDTAFPPQFQPSSIPTTLTSLQSSSNKNDDLRQAAKSKKENSPTKRKKSNFLHSSATLKSLPKHEQSFPPMVAIHDNIASAAGLKAAAQQAPPNKNKNNDNINIYTTIDPQSVYAHSIHNQYLRTAASMMEAPITHMLVAHNQTNTVPASVGSVPNHQHHLPSVKESSPSVLATSVAAKSKQGSSNSKKSKEKKPKNANKAPKDINSNTSVPLTIKEPGRLDVICARGKNPKNHPGNVVYRQMVLDKLDEYSRTTSKQGKSLLVSQIVDTVRRSSPAGGFIKYQNGQWFEVGDHLAREKVGQAFRDSLHDKYTSSTKAKRQRYRKERAETAIQTGVIAPPDSKKRRLGKRKDDVAAVVLMNMKPSINK
jgi:hypothetical protein